MKFEELTRKELRAIALEFLENEGYDNGNEYETLKEYYEGTRRPPMEITEEEASILACEQGEICGA